MVKVRIGNKEFELSQQARFVLYVWLVILAVSFLAILINPKNLLLKLSMFVFNVIMSVLYIYVVNCYVVGGCNILAWVVVVFMLVYVVLSTLTIATMSLPLANALKP